MSEETEPDEVLWRQQFTEEITRMCFRCPGCGFTHCLTIAPEHLAWQWNGDTRKPTFSPSILVTAAGGGDERRCHSHVKDGSIQFLEDCHHALKGQTVPLPLWNREPAQ